MSRQIKKGSVDQSTVIRIVDSGDGTPETGVVFNTTGIDLWYRRELEAKVSITEATLAALTTAHADGGFLHIGDGYYRLDLPDAAWATGADGVAIGGTVTGMCVIGSYHPLVAVDAQDAVRFGLTALPNVASGSAGAIPTTGSGANQIAVNGSGKVSGVVLTDALTTYTGNTPQTGDNFARIGAAGTGLTDLGGMSTTMKAQVNTEADTALADYDAPTSAELDARTDAIDAALVALAAYVDTEVAAIKAKTDNLPTDPADQSLVIAATDAIVTAVNAVPGQVTTDHGSGSYVDTGAGGDASAANQTAIIAALADVADHRLPLYTPEETGDYHGRLHGSLKPYLVDDAAQYKAIRFDGIDRNDSSAGIDCGTVHFAAAFTLEFDITPASVPAVTATIMGDEYSLAPFGGNTVAALASDGRLALSIRNASSLTQSISSDSALTPGTRYVVQMNYDATTIRMLIDGVLQADTEAVAGLTTQLHSPENHWWIGRRPSEPGAAVAAGWPFPVPATIGRVRITNGVARNTADYTPVTGQLSADANTVALYNMERIDAVGRVDVGLIEGVDATDQLAANAAGGDATAANQTTIINRIGAFTGSGLNTILGFFRAVMRKDAALTPSDVGGTFDNTTDSEEAIRDNQAAGSGVTIGQLTAMLTGQEFPVIDITGAGQHITITRGDTFPSTEPTATALTFTKRAGEYWPTDLSDGWTLTFTAKVETDNIKSGTTAGSQTTLTNTPSVVTATGDSQAVRVNDFTLSHVQNLSVGDHVYDFDIQVLKGSHRITLRFGTITVREDLTTS